MLHFVSHMALLQATPMIGTTEPSSSVPGSSDRYAQFLTACSFEIISILNNFNNFNFRAPTLCIIISLIVQKNNITQTDGHQFSCELFQSCSYDSKQ